MNNDNELDNEEYVLVEFDINNNNNNNDDDHGMIIIDNNNDNDDDFDDSSYVQCDEELSLNPSITASVCSETMFGELSCLQQQQRQLLQQQQQSHPQDDGGREGDTNTQCVGRNRACSIVSLYDEDDHNMIVPPVDMVKNSNVMDMDTEDDELPPIKGDDKNKERTMVTATLKKGIKNARPSSANTAPVTSIITTTNQVSGSRLSNKKRRKKMKQLKKAAALAAFAAIKEQQEQERDVTTVPMTTTPSSTSSSKHRKTTSKGVVTMKKTTNIAVLCAREAMLSYEQGLKEQLEQQKKVNGTLNFNV